VVDSFCKFYSEIESDLKERIDTSTLSKRPSLVAHSFGTYVIGNALLKYDDIVLDKLILCGSILPTDFDWGLILDRCQVNYILNDYGVEDNWSKLAKYFIPDSGDSGANGFPLKSGIIRQERRVFFRHSDYFKRSHMKNNWAPFLCKKPPSYRTMNGSAIRNREEFKQIFKETGEIDDYCFGALPDYAASEPSDELVMEWVTINPDIYTFLKDDNGTIGGYINAMPISDEIYNRILTGILLESEICPDHLELFEPNSTVKLFLMSIAFSEALQKLTNGLLNDCYWLDSYWEETLQVSWNATSDCRLKRETRFFTRFCKSVNKVSWGKLLPRHSTFV
jgi:pimeloyl-ACP methyl ester carboxylesterase